MTQTLKQFLHTLENRPLAALIEGAANGVKIIADAMRCSSKQSAGSGQLSGYSNVKNVQGETQAELDIFADKVMSDAFFSSGAVAALVSEEQPEMLAGSNANAEFVVAHDPLDGSSNIPYNIPVGTIFTVFCRANLAVPASVADYFQPASGLCAAGYAVYGLATQFVFSAGNGVIDAVLDGASNEFIVRNLGLRQQPNGVIFSVNEGNAASFSAPVQLFLSELKNSGRYSGRYVGSLVSDFDRNLRKGGIYLYPADSKNPKGKLRLLYECMPLAFIAEQAGGGSSDGQCSILDVIPTAIHQRSPLFIGSQREVLQLTRLITAET